MVGCAGLVDFMMYWLSNISTPPMDPPHPSTHRKRPHNARVLALAVGEGALEVGIEGEEDEREGDVPRQRREGALVPVVVGLGGGGLLVVCWWLISLGACCGLD